MCFYEELILIDHTIHAPYEDSDVEVGIFDHPFAHAGDATLT